MSNRVLGVKSDGGLLLRFFIGGIVGRGLFMKKVLIVDDEPSYRDPLRSALSSEGLEMRTAADGRDAFKVAAGFGPDILIMDWVLRNREDGVQVAETLIKKNPNLRLIMITGYPTAGLEAQIKDFGPAQILAKPFRLDELIAAIRNATDSES